MSLRWMVSPSRIQNPGTPLMSRPSSRRMKKSATASSTSPTAIQSAMGMHLSGTKVGCIPPQRMGFPSAWRTRSVRYFAMRWKALARTEKPTTSISRSRSNSMRAWTSSSRGHGKRLLTQSLK